VLEKQNNALLLTEYKAMLIAGMFGNMFLYLISLQQARCKAFACYKTSPCWTFRCGPTTSHGTTNCKEGTNEFSGRTPCSQDRKQWEAVSRAVALLCSAVLSVYRACLVMTVHRILAADTRYKGVKKLLEVGTYSSTLHHCAHV
jgi:hypothetical protein